MLKESQKMPRFVTPEHFAAIYDKWGAARCPADQSYTVRGWWQALITFAYMTGWRIGECLALKRADLDLENGRATTRAGDNKGKRDEVVPLHALVVDHLRRIAKSR
jgi:integrase